MAQYILLAAHVAIHIVPGVTMAISFLVTAYLGENRDIDDESEPLSDDGDWTSEIDWVSPGDLFED